MKGFRVVGLTLVVILTGCSDGAPLDIANTHPEYVGVWQTRHEVFDKGSTEIDNMLLAINADGTSVYRKCRFSESKSDNSSRSTRISVSLPSAFVTALSGDNITLLQKVWRFGFKKELQLDGPPSPRDGRWYLGVEGKTLTRLQADEVREQTDWTCPGGDDA